MTRESRSALRVCVSACPWAVLVLLVALPLAAAEHEFSHRLMVVGRVVDADGDPVPGERVSLALSGARDAGDCYDTRDPKTNETGDFTVCRHVHGLARGVDATIAVAGVERAFRIDDELRRAYLAIHLDGDWPVRSIEGEREFARVFLVTGRVFDERPGGVTVEEVLVNATPRQGRNVSVELLGADNATLATATAATSDQGDFLAALRIAHVPEGARVRVDLGFGVEERPADAALRRADVELMNAPPLVSTVTPPGAQTPEVPMGAPVALGALGAAALVYGARARRR